MTLYIEEAYMNKSMKKNIQHFFLFTAFAAGTIHLINRFIDATAGMKHILDADNGDYYDWKDGKIYYTKRGSGSPILFIHDLNPISSSYEWCRFAKRLERNHTVYTLDLLGCGNSDKPYLTYTNYLYVQLITDFVKNVIGEETDVISTGISVSFVALADSIDHKLFKHIITINPPLPSSFCKMSGRHLFLKKKLLELPIIGTFLYNIKTYEKNIQQVFHDNYFARPHLVSSKMLDAYYEAAHINHSHGKYLMASIEGHYIDNSIVHVLKKIQTPFYIVESRNMPNDVSITNAYTKLNPSIETVFLSNTKLLPQLEAPDKLLEIVTMLLQKM